jgi:hypothetical protein
MLDVCVAVPQSDADVHFDRRRVGLRRFPIASCRDLCEQVGRKLSAPAGDGVAGSHAEKRRRATLSPFVDVMVADRVAGDEDSTHRGVRLRGGSGIG